MPALRLFDGFSRTTTDGIAFFRLRESFFFVPLCLGGEIPGLERATPKPFGQVHSTSLPCPA